jgi:hypothetical protein
MARLGQRPARRFQVARADEQPAAAVALNSLAFISWITAPGG